MQATQRNNYMRGCRQIEKHIDIEQIDNQVYTRHYWIMNESK